MTVVIIIRSDKIHNLSGQVKKVARVSKQDICYTIYQRAIKMLMGSMICAFVVHIGYKTCLRMMGSVEKSLLPEKEA